MNKYQEFKNNRQEAFEAVPKFFAFDNEQFEKNYKKFQEKNPDTIGKEIFNIGLSGFTTKKYCDELVRLNEEYKEKAKELFKDQDVLFDAFYYEMWNIEYGYNLDDERLAHEILDKNFDELTEEELNTFKKAEKKYFEVFEG